MSKTIGFLISIAIGAFGSSANAQTIAEIDTHAIDQPLSGDPQDVIVRGISGERYRIDPSVMEASRSADAQAMRSVNRGAWSEAPFDGEHRAGGTTTVLSLASGAVSVTPLVTNADDWRDVIRADPDQYQAYDDAKRKVR